MNKLRKNEALPETRIVPEPRLAGNGGYKPVLSILILAWPVVLEMALHTFVWIFDMAMVMRLGAREASAVEYGALVFFNTLAVFGALGIGVNSLVARYTGAKDMKRASLIGGQALSIGLVIAAGFAGLGYLFGKPFFGWIIKDTVTAVLTVDYFYITLLSGGFMWLLILVSNGIIRGTGNTRVPMLIALVVNIYNIVGDYLLIFGNCGFPAMGVKGAALATGSAQLLGAVLSVGYLFMQKGKLPFSFACMFPLRKEVIRQVLRLSVPAGAEEVAHNGSRLLSATWITALGPIAFAANAAAIAAESFSFMPGYAFAISATILVGQRLGAGFPGQARETGYWACAIGTALMSFFGMIFLFFPYAVMSLFNPPEPEVLRLGVLCLQIAAVEQPFVAMSMAFSGALRGTGDTRGPFQIGLVSNLLVRLPLIYAIVYLFRLEVTYIWWATAMQYALSSLLLYLRYRRAKWHEMSTAPPAATGS
ncbi:MAG: MATE family efflux transporter [Bacillota bacterium]